MGMKLIKGSFFDLSIRDAFEKCALIEKYIKSWFWGWNLDFLWNIKINLIRKARFNWNSIFFTFLLTYFVIAHIRLKVFRRI